MENIRAIWYNNISTSSCTCNGLHQRPGQQCHQCLGPHAGCYQDTASPLWSGCNLQVWGGKTWDRGGSHRVIQLTCLPADCTWTLFSAVLHKKLWCWNHIRITREDHSRTHVKTMMEAKTGGNFVTSKVFMFDPRLCPAANVQHLITSKVGLQCHHCVSPCRTSGWSQARLD